MFSFFGAGQQDADGQSGRQNRNKNAEAAKSTEHDGANKKLDELKPKKLVNIVIFFSIGLFSFNLWLFHFSF